MTDSDERCSLPSMTFTRPTLRAMAHGTVPFALWVTATHLDDYPAAVAACVAAGGDVDTSAAIAGGVVAAYTRVAGVPAAWLAAREPLPGWLTAADSIGGDPPL